MYKTENKDKSCIRNNNFYLYFFNITKRSYAFARGFCLISKCLFLGLKAPGTELLRAGCKSLLRLTTFPYYFSFKRTVAMSYPRPPHAGQVLRSYSGTSRASREKSLLLGIIL